MQYLRQTVVALSVLLVGVGCSENPTQKELTNETIRLNKTLIDEGAINPKTQYLKNGEDVKIAPAVEIDKPATYVNYDAKLEKIIVDRDAAIRANVELKKINSDLKSQTSTLSETQSLSKGKIVAGAAALLAAQQLTADRDGQIAKLIAERDEAIRVTLEMKKANTDVEVQTSDLNTQIQALMQTQSEYKSASSEKIAASVLAIEDAQRLTSDRDGQIAKLIKERDEAIRVTLEMKNANSDLETKVSSAGTESERLLENKTRELDKLTNDLSHMNDNITRETQAKQEALDELASLKDKLAASASQLTDAKSLTTDRDGKINSLIHERDEAIKVTLEMKKASEAFEVQKTDWDTKIQSLMQTKNDNESSSKGKIAAAATALLAAQQLTADRNTDIEKLIAERDEAIRVTLEMKNANADFEAKASSAVDASGKLLEDRKNEIDKLTNDLAHLNDNIKNEADTKQEALANLVNERDEAIKVTLEMKKENEELNEKLKNLAQVHGESDSSSKDKIAKLATLLSEAEQLTLERDSTIENLTKEKDAAIQVAMGMKKDSVDFEAQQTNWDTKIQALTQTQNENESAIEDAKKLIVDRDSDIEKLAAERDEAIRVTLEMKKASADFEAQKLDLDGKIQTLMQTQNDSESASKGKIATAAAALLAAQQLTADRDFDIEKLAAERDEAIRVTLEMKKASADFEAQKSDLDGKIQTLIQTQSDGESVSKEKIVKLASALTEADKLTLERDATIESLTKEKDAAIQVAMGMKKDSVDFEKSMQESAKNESVSKEKIIKLAALLSDAEKSTLDKDANIARLIKERDAAIQVSMGMQKSLEDGKKASAKQLVLNNIVSTFKLSKVEFKTGSAILTEKSTGLLDKVADIMKSHSEYNYKVQGHTDSQGKKELNLKLSENRAKSVKDYLVSKGVSDTTLSSEGFGSSTPIADNATRSGRLQNRRVVFEIVN